MPSERASGPAAGGSGCPERVAAAIIPVSGAYFGSDGVLSPRRDRSRHPVVRLARCPLAAAVVRLAQAGAAPPGAGARAGGLWPRAAPPRAAHARLRFRDPARGADPGRLAWRVL